MIWITGSLGFIGTNLALHYLRKGEKVLGIDNLSRKGSEDNLKILQKYSNFIFLPMNVETLTTAENLASLLIEGEPDVIFHMAAQVGVTKSIESPMLDFATNVWGTLSILEYARACKKPPIVLFASTNKVYGDIQTNEPIGEDTPLDFHTPYGVSKGSADQYVLDYYRTYNIPTVVFRQSCIYGTYQCGSQEQGWVDHFIRTVAFGDGKLNFFGDGTQRRDVLYIDDLVELYALAVQKIEEIKGQVFNIGGGKNNTLSLNECIEIIEEESEKKADITYHDFRPSDQKCYISNVDKVWYKLGWRPTVTPLEGIRKCITHIKDAKD